MKDNSKCVLCGWELNMDVNNLLCNMFADSLKKQKQQFTGLVYFYVSCTNPKCKAEFGLDTKVRIKQANPLYRESLWGTMIKLDARCEKETSEIKIPEGSVVMIKKHRELELSSCHLGYLYVPRLYSLQRKKREDFRSEKLKEKMISYAKEHPDELDNLKIVSKDSVAQIIKGKPDSYGYVNHKHLLVEVETEKRLNHT
jgi:hypothetical protein